MNIHQRKWGRGCRQVSKIAQQVKVLSAKYNDVCLIPRIHMVEEENQLLLLSL